MTLRKYLLDAALDRVTSSMQLRRPQHEALREFHSLIEYLPDDLGTIAAQDLLSRVHEYRPQWSLEPPSAHMSFALATGVGKSRLMAALIAYLALSGQAKNFVLLAPRRTVLDKFLRELSPTSGRYLFVDPSLVPDSKVWHSDNIASFRDEAAYEGLYPSDPVNIFVLSPQSLVGDDRRVAQVDEFSGVSVQNWLKSTDDLVVLSDEAHHFGRLGSTESAAWTQAVRDLEPKLHLLFTATPSIDANALYAYDLATSLRERLYTKDVRVIAKERPRASAVTDEDWDQVTLEYALGRLNQKRAAVQLASASGFPALEPVLLVCCVDTAHADQVAAWLSQSGHLTTDEVLVAHSKRGKSEDDLARLLAVDKPGSKVRVVVTVFQLTEGWDVSNVYVIAPLRSMATFTGAVQTLGRGLRLPAGRRVDEAELDTLDVLTFGRESLDEILAGATKSFGEDDAGLTVRVTDADEPEINRPVPTKALVLPLVTPRSFGLPRMRVIQTEPELDFEPGAAKHLAGVAAQEFSVVARVVKQAEDSVRLTRDSFIAMTVQRVIGTLPYLSLPLHGTAVTRLVERFLEATSEDPGAEMINYDWRLAGDLLSRQIDAAYRRTAKTSFQVTGVSTVELRDQTIHVAPDWKSPLSQLGLNWSADTVRQPVNAWIRCTHRLASFDTRGEFHVARLLDRSDVDWWLRNDPALVRLPTPIGFFGPDFVVSQAEGKRVILMEIKGSNLWSAPDSDARLKSAAADAYCAEISGATDQTWEHWLVLDEDAKSANSLEELRGLRVNGRRGGSS